VIGKPPSVAQIQLMALTAIAASATFIASAVADATDHKVVGLVLGMMCGGHVARWFGLAFFGAGGGDDDRP